MPPIENQPIKPVQQGAELGLEPPQLYVFTGDRNASPNPYQFTGNGQEVKSGPQIYMGPVGQDWGPRIGPSERRIEQMPAGPAKDAALARETNVLFNVPVALKAYRDDIKAADAIDQLDVARRNTANVSLLKDNQTQLAQAKAVNAPPEQMNALLKKQDDLQNAQKLVVADYYAPATTRINAGLALITTGQDMLVDYGQNLIGEALKLRPELRDNPLFQKNLEAARRECAKNREAAFGGEIKDPYQWSGDGSVPGGIPQKRPGVPGQPGRGPDGRALPQGNPGFTPIPGYDAPPQQNQPQPFPQFRRGGETPDNTRRDRPQPQKPVEDFTPPGQPPKAKGVDKSAWDQVSDSQKMLAAALAAFLGYKLIQRGNRILAERSRDAGNEALGKTPENAAKLKEAIERAGKEVARDNVVKANLVKEGEHAGKYEVTGPDGKKEFMSETDFKEKYSETGKPGEYKSWLSDRTKAVQLPELAALNEEMGLGKQADRKMWAVVENGEVKLLTDKEFKQGWRAPSDADKASWALDAERKLTPEQKAEREAARVEAERVAAEKETARVAAEKETARVEAERVAAEKETARVAAEKETARVEAERVAAEKETARVAAEKETARVEAERVAAEKETARVAAEKETARVEAERVAAEKETARVAAEKETARVEAERVAAEKETARVAAEKETARVEAERVAAEKETARVAAEKETARVEAERVAAEKETARVAAEKETARVEAERVAAEKVAAEGRFKPAAGADILPGIKVDQSVKVDGVNWTAAGKVEDRPTGAERADERITRIILKKEGGIARGKTPQTFEPEKFNRVEINGESGTYFQRKGTSSIYQYIPLDGFKANDPQPGKGFIFKLDGVEARPSGSPIVQAFFKPGETPGTKPEPKKAETPEVAKPAVEPAKTAKEVLAPHQFAALNALDRTLAEAQKYLAEKPTGEGGTFKFAEPLKLNFHDKPLTVSAIEIHDGKMYLKSATDGKCYSAEGWLETMKEGLQERASSTTIAAAEVQAAKLSLEALSASPEARVALIKGLAGNFALESKSIVPTAELTATAVPTAIRKGALPGTAGISGGVPVASTGGADIRKTEGGGYEVTGVRPGDSAVASGEPIAKDKMDRIKADILEDKERKFTPEEKRRALAVLEMAERGNVEAREAVRTAVERSGGFDKTTGALCGVGLVVLTLGGVYAYQKLKSATPTQVAEAKIN